MIQRFLVPITAAALTMGSSALAGGATLCVNPGGSSGCFATIGEAVKTAAPGDTIQVAAGTYKEAVVIGKPLSLVGAGPERVILDATGLPNGIYIDGIDNPALSNIVVSNFTVQNANFEGILITNASSVTVWNNHIIGNDKGLNAAAGTCPGQPAFETSEGDDCGEGIHLSGVDHSTIGKNLVTGNSGGILISDDTAATHDNLITENDVRLNPFDCGITLASHPPATVSGSATPLGVFHNTVSGNKSIRNGLQGAGAGAGMFASVPGAQTYGNVIINNRLIGNHNAGVAMHSHTPNQILNDNKIIGNYISGNQADSADAATPGPVGINVFGVSPVTGTLIVQNIFEDEALDIVVNTPAQVDVHLNSFPDHGVGVNNLGAGSANATENWWGCPQGPDSGLESCATAGGPNVNTTPWLRTPPQPSLSPSK
jgi:nitrous oxidase accessory protein NosD